MKYRRYEGIIGQTFAYDIYSFLKDKGVTEKCIVCYALGDVENGIDHITSVGNLLFSMDDINHDDILQNFGLENDVLYIYGYTLIDEVILTHGYA